jgi:tRNA(Ile)-lysidine synthase
MCDMKETTSLAARVRDDTLRRTPALAGGGAVLAASGGADSTAMVSLMCEVGAVDPAASVVAHFDHGLRGRADGAADVAVVEALCRRYGLELVTGRWEEPRPGEAAAREARYRFLTGVADAHGIPAVVTGHTADDQAETVLLHVLRGAGLHGLRGMRRESALPVRRAREDVVLARPLLGVTRAEARAWCAEQGLAFHDDASNEDLRFLRNRVRRVLLPDLQRRVPDAPDILVRASEVAAARVRVLDRIAEGILGREGHVVRISRDALRSTPPAVRAHAVRLGIVELLGDARDFGRRHYATVTLAHIAATGSTFRLPRDVHVTVDADAVVLSVGPPGPPPVEHGAEHTVPFSGRVGAWTLDVQTMRDARSGGDVVPLPADAIVRGRRRGDRIRPRGMRGHKKLQDYYVDRKVPRRERDAAPVIAVGGDVLWTPFGGGSVDAVGAPHGVTAVRVACQPV